MQNTVNINEIKILSFIACLSVKAAFTFLQHSVINYKRGELSLKSLWQFMFVYWTNYLSSLCL